MKTKLTTLLLTLLLFFTLTTTATAQNEQPELSIRLNRQFGTGGIGNGIQGLFTITVSGPDNLVEVRFYLDDQLMGNDTEKPFKLSFNTSSYDTGTHTISAVGILSDGTEIRSSGIVRDFLTGGQTVLIVGGILVAVLLFQVVPAMMNKKGGTRPIGEYGAAGGAVCPHCQFPFSRNMFSPNMVVGKLARCPHCGKWSIRPRASQAELAAAEERLRASRQESGGEIEVDEQDQIRRALDDSKFDE